jgi:UDP-glucose 4-epimerase
MNVLIFGGAGFVGRHYVLSFLNKGFYVEVIDNIAPLSGGITPKKWKLYSIHISIEKSLIFKKKIAEIILKVF